MTSVETHGLHQRMAAGKLIKIRASQLNGCAYGLDMHTRDARDAGEDGHGVTDEVWNAAAAHFDEPELAQVVWAIAAINSWNRMGVATHLPPAP